MNLPVASHGGVILNGPCLIKKGLISGIVGNSVDITHLKTVEKETIEGKENAELLRNSEIELRKAITVLWAMK